MRYIWVFFDTYFPRGVNPKKFIKRTLMKLLVPYLKRWDRKTNESVDYFIANSKNIRQRIKSVYSRGAAVVYPPVDTDFFYPIESKKDYYLLVSALVPYKRADVAIEAFKNIDAKLYVVGDGACFNELTKKAPENVKFLKWVGASALRTLYQECRALIFCAEEDFGIVPLEAASCGRPTICYKKGGALETVIDIKEDKTHATGVFFNEQTPESLAEAISFFEKVEDQFDPFQIRENALKFSRNAFKENFQKIVSEIKNFKR